MKSNSDWGWATSLVVAFMWIFAVATGSAEIWASGSQPRRPPGKIEVLASPQASPTFGVAVAAAGEWIAVGDDRAWDGLVEGGRVELFTRDGDGRWILVQTIESRDGGPFDRFGAAVAIDGDRLLIGAPGPDGVGGGFAELHRLRKGRWVFEAWLGAEDVGPLDRFGAAVALAGDLAVVSAPRRDSADLDAGAVAIFRGETGWRDATWLTAPDAAAGDWFGASVATDGVRVVVGATGDDDLGEKSGSAWVFRRDGDAWRDEAKLLPTQGGEREWFGHAVAVARNVVLVGAPRADPQGTTSGAVWAFAGDASGWAAVSEVPAAGGRPGDWFGFDLAIAGSLAIVGSPGRDLVGEGGELEDCGDAVRLVRRGRRWASDGRVGSDPRAGVRLRGSAVAISSDVIVIGHRPVEDGPEVPGEVWVGPRR